jgi:hypothetical protein
MFGAPTGTAGARGRHVAELPWLGGLTPRLYANRSPGAAQRITVASGRKGAATWETPLPSAETLRAPPERGPRPGDYVTFLRLPRFGPRRLPADPRPNPSGGNTGHKYIMAATDMEALVVPDSATGSHPFGRCGKWQLAGRRLGMGFKASSLRRSVRAPCGNRPSCPTRAALWSSAEEAIYRSSVPIRTLAFITGRNAASAP